MAISFELAESSLRRPRRHYRQGRARRADAADLAQATTTRSTSCPVGVGRLLVEARAARARNPSGLRAWTDGIDPGLHPGRGALLGRRRALPAHADGGAGRLRRLGSRHARNRSEKFHGRPSSGDGPHPVWGAMAITEPGAGSDSAAIQTTAELDGDEYVLNGTKIFCTSGESAATQFEGGFVVVWATIDKSAGRGGIKSFVVIRRTRRAWSSSGCEKKLGIRASDTADAAMFENCRVPKASTTCWAALEVKKKGDSKDRRRQGLQGRDGDLRCQPSDRRGHGDRASAVQSLDFLKRGSSSEQGDRDPLRRGAPSS